MELPDLVADFASAIKTADAKRPQAVNVRSKEPFQPGIGPHSEADTVELVARELREARADRYADRLLTAVPYPQLKRQKCDLCIGSLSHLEWAIEVKMLRILGDNGKANDNILMHILSPYPAHRSALTDCDKLIASRFQARKAILIYGYDSADWPLTVAIEAFVALARTRVRLGAKSEASFNSLVHPVHTSGAVFGWELLGSAAA